MKNLKYFIGIIFIVISGSSYSQLKVGSSGTVGIGIDPVSTYNLRLNNTIFVTGNNYPDLIIGTDPVNYGRAIYPSQNNMCRVGLPNNQFAAVYAQYHYAGTTYHFSDTRLKENLSIIEKPLEKLLQINGVKYDFIKQSNDTTGNEAERQKLEEMRKNKFGFLAQDLEKILPEAVLYDKEQDRYYIEYNTLIPVIVEAMKEQQAQIEGLKAELADCCQNNLKSGSLSTTTNEANNENIPTLDQNIPNPFSNETRIGCFIPAIVGKADLYIYNLS